MYLVDEKPVGSNMTFAVVDLVADKRMVVIFRRQFLAIGELVIFLEPIGPVNKIFLAHRASSANASSSLR